MYAKYLGVAASQTGETSSLQHPPTSMMARQLQKTASDSDDANTESQQMIAVAHLLKQRKSHEKEMRQLRAKIQADHGSLNSLLDQRMRQTEIQAIDRRHEMVDSILKALGPPSEPNHRKTTTIAGTKIADHATYTSTTDVLAQSKGLVKEYEGLDGMISDMRSQQGDSVADTWKRKIRESEEQLRKGARVAARNVKKVLGADMSIDEAYKMEVDRKVEIQQDKGDNLSYELQRSLRYAERGVKRMAKGLPFEEA
ncbi:hypothetical protein LEMA_P121200.1 [Plenodomus lingam JN3]|uniref:Uncharacterized protein n=1 Tax=Leptosphaeria maculans (strain JN3 / isolate v23.1.3 / race Av1-4-5-6-7-8) TaxID=985895 RepID=E4ZSH6_LEPMJ|nr:hypothetical protein LEMA_P121200.1 [Plenodomus lingam JN3]CBX94356.1 hypothetical protein LEMA_P121200.1 [Plenodomus lingam JN3]